MTKGKKGKSLSAKQHLALTTALVGAAIASYVRRSYAACANVGGTTYLCTGDTTVNTATQNLFVNNATISTAAGFGVDTTASGGAAIRIPNGNGVLSFTDIYGSTIRAAGRGLEFYNNGGYLYATPPSITINTSAGTQITAGGNGIFAYGYGYNSTSITLGGSITANGNGIYARNNNILSNGITINTNTGSSIVGNLSGIRTRSNGASTTITVNGNVTGSTAIAVNAINDNYASNITITTASSSALAGVQGIQAINNGTGATNITVGGAIVAGNIGILGFNGGATTDLNITTNTGSTLSANGLAGIYTAFNNVASSTHITVNGALSATNFGIYDLAHSATNDITVQNGATINATNGAIRADYSFGTHVTLDGRGGAVTVTGTPIAVALSNTGNDTLSFLGPATLHGSAYGNGGTNTLDFNVANVAVDTGAALRTFSNITVTGDSTLNGDINSGGISVTMSSSSSGSLHLNGALTATSLTIGNNTTFAGNNTVTGDVTVNSGGHIAPGNSIGTINVIGNVDFNSGSFLDVEVAGASADLLNVTGNVNINSGAILNLTPLAPFTGSHTDIITATGTVSGTFGTVNFNGVTASVLYTPTSVFLGAGSGTTTVSVLSLNSSAFNAQMQASLGSSLAFDDLMASKTVEGVFERGNYYWAKALYRHTDKDPEDGYAGFSNNAYGLALGHQRELSPRWKVGVSLAELGHDLNGQSNSSDSNGNSTFGFLYATYTQPVKSAQWFTTLGFTAGYHNNDGERLVSNNGVAAHAQADYHDTDVGGMLQTGLRIPLSEHWDFTPKVGVSYLHTMADGFTETGGGAAGVSINDYDFDTVKVREGVALSNNALMLTNTIKVRPTAELGFSQELAATGRDISGTFSNGTRFITRLDDQDHHFANIAVGADFDLAPGVTGFISYEKSFRAKENRDDARIGVSVQF